MKTLELINALIPLITQAGIPLVKLAIDAFEKDPTLPADQLAAAIDARIADARKNDAEVEVSQA